MFVMSDGAEINAVKCNETYASYIWEQYLRNKCFCCEVLVTEQYIIWCLESFSPPQNMR